MAARSWVVAPLARLSSSCRSQIWRGGKEEELVQPLLDSSRIILKETVDTDNDVGAETAERGEETETNRGQRL